MPKSKKSKQSKRSKTPKAVATAARDYKPGELLERVTAAGLLLSHVDVYDMVAMRATCRMLNEAGKRLDEDPRWWRTMCIEIYWMMFREYGFNRGIPETHSCWKLAYKALVGGDHCMDGILALANVAAGSLAKPEVMCYGSLSADLRLQVPALEMTLKLPLKPDALLRLVKHAGERAPLGKGAETVVDLKARSTWRFALGSEVLILPGAGSDSSSDSESDSDDNSSNRSRSDSESASSSCSASDRGAAFASGGVPSAVLDEVKRTLAPALSGRAEVVVEPYQLLVYEEGDFFKPHRDTVRGPRHFASLVVYLPVANDVAGGALLLRHKGVTTSVLDGSKALGTMPVVSSHDGAGLLSRDAQNSDIRWAAFFTDVEHEVTKVTRGMRVTMTYHLHWERTDDTLPRVPKSLHQTEPGTLELLGALLHLRTGHDETGELWGFALEHQYTEKTLPMLKGRAGKNCWGLQVRRKWQKLRGADMSLFLVLSNALDAHQLGRARQAHAPARERARQAQAPLRARQRGHDRARAHVRRHHAPHQPHARVLRPAQARPGRLHEERRVEPRARERGPGEQFPLGAPLKRNPPLLLRPLFREKREALFACSACSFTLFYSDELFEAWLDKLWRGMRARLMLSLPGEEWLKTWLKPQ